MDTEPTWLMGRQARLSCRELSPLNAPPLGALLDCHCEVHRPDPSGCLCLHNQVEYASLRPARAVTCPDPHHSQSPRRKGDPLFASQSLVRLSDCGCGSEPCVTSTFLGTQGVQKP